MKERPILFSAPMVRAIGKLAARSQRLLESLFDEEKAAAVHAAEIVG